MGLILVVDDERDIRILAADIIKTLGHTPILSPDGQHAYELLKVNDSIDLLITDIFMPKMDGRELIRKFRGNNEHSKIPILAMSGYISHKEIPTLFDLGADAFLDKPFSYNDFENIIRKLLKK